MHRIYVSLILLVTCLSLIGSAIAVRNPFGNGHPVVIGVDPNWALPGDTVLVTVQLDQTVDADQNVSITSSDTAAFSSIPSTVTVTSGHDSVSFYVTFSTTATGGPTISASAN